MAEPWLSMHGELLFDSAAPTPSVRVDLEARSPAIALTGPSGSGKSTLLRALATTSHHFTGTVRALGESWAGEDGRSKVSPWRRGIGWVPQDSLLFPHLTVAENLRFGRTQRPGPVDESALLTWLAIAHLLPRHPRHLSGGETQRVALGRALLAAPRVLLLDEPFTALPRAVRDDLAGRLRVHIDQHSIHAVVVSHDAQSIRSLTDEAFTIADGTLQPAAP